MQGANPEAGPGPTTCGLNLLHLDNRSTAYHNIGKGRDTLQGRHIHVPCPKEPNRYKHHRPLLYELEQLFNKTLHTIGKANCSTLHVQHVA